MITYDDIKFNLRKGDEKKGEYWDELTSELHLTFSVKIEKMSAQKDPRLRDDAEKHCRHLLVEKIFGELRHEAIKSAADLK